MRKDLNMRKGKMIAQGAHASMKVILDMMIKQYNGPNHELRLLHTVKGEPLDEWLSGLFTKIVVGVNSDFELLKAYTIAIAAGIPCALIEDAGNTEFHGHPTYTCCAIGPDEAEKIDKITGDLPLL